MIELQGAEFVAGTVDGSVRVLHPITLSLRERRIALIGANGSGKSTLARMLNGLVEPSVGRVRVRIEDGIGGHGGGGAATGKGARDARSDVGAARWIDTRSDGAAVRRRVGFVFTDPASQLVMPTVLEDVALSLRRQYTGKVERVAAAHEALARFGLDDLAGRSVHSLSGGQQQLLAIAGVLAGSPATVVADEPTTLLDLRNGRMISDLLLALPQQVIVATHDLELAARCDRVIVIADGAVAFDSAGAVEVNALGAVPRSAAGVSGDTGARARTPADAVAWYREHA